MKKNLKDKKSLNMRQFKNYIFLSILTGVVLLIGRSVLLKICNITGV